jgi:ATP/ADP translocase
MAITSLVAASLPSLQRALQLGRGGATILAATAVSSSLTGATGINGGATATIVDDGNVQIFGQSVTPKARAVLCMAIAMSLHYLGYSLARPSTLAIFTSSSTGYANAPAAFPLAMAFVSPMSLLLLMGYGKTLEANGPKGALPRTTIFCASIIVASALAIMYLEKSGSALTLFNIPLVKFIAGPLFVFREAYVQLITSQYWSFMSSVLTPSQSGKWFAPISGLTSITSALAGINVSRVVDKVGLTGALAGTGIMMLLSLIATTKAYAISDRYGFTPSDDHKHEQKKVKGAAQTEEMGMFQKASKLFTRVPTLWALFLEILSSQGLATLLNICFVSKLSTAIPNDSDRAGWMGKFFALINVFSMVLQFGVLPPLMQVIEPRDLWRAMPLIALCFTGFQATQVDPSLYIVSASLLVQKTLEYSVRRMLDEMVYVPLDFESRYVGKEIIGVFGYRFGKSSMSLCLSAFTGVFGNLGLQELSVLTSGATLLWLSSAWKLSNLVPTRKEAEGLYHAKKSK